MKVPPHYWTVKMFKFVGGKKSDLEKNLFFHMDMYLSSTCHLLIFMLFNIVPVPLPDIKFGLLLEAFLVF